ncbi:hypothetical protein J6590_038181 [Homalodisca vitripennis]|nr:hypothetical protein J6590_038181 [Homalodisca vitripennis]
MRFAQQSFTVEIYENEQAGTLVEHLDTGTIRDKTQLHYESIVVPSVTVTVRVVDLGEPQHTSDVNDCMPHFLYAEYNLSMIVPLYPDSRIIQVKTSDEDTPAVTNLRYMILTGNKEKWLHLEPESGLLLSKHETSHSLRVEFSVTVVSILGDSLNKDIRFVLANPFPLFRICTTSGTFITTGVPFEQQEQDHNFINVQPVLATDGAGRSDFSTVRVTVNDNAPEFHFPEYHTCISANLTVDSVFLKLTVVDPDSGGLDYYITERDEITIPIRSSAQHYLTYIGSSWTAMKFERWLPTPHRILRDPPLSSLAHLQILVVYVNDNPPEFSSRSYHALVFEDAPVGTEVTGMSATYLDDGVQTSVVYSIMPGNNKSERLNRAKYSAGRQGLNGSYIKQNTIKPKRQFIARRTEIPFKVLDVCCRGKQDKGGQRASCFWFRVFIEPTQRVVPW